MPGFANYVPSAILFCAFILLLLVSISLPTFSTFDIARVHASTDFFKNFAEIRFGIWGGCGIVGSAKNCPFTGHGYEVIITDDITIGPSWTRGLAIHPVEAGLTFVALVLSFSPDAKHALISGIITAVAAFITLIGLAINIAFYAFAKHQYNKLDLGSILSTTTGPGFWLTFVSLILLIICSVLFVGKRRGDSGSSEGFSLKRFRRGIY